MSSAIIRLTDGRSFTADEVLELINASEKVLAYVSPQARRHARRYGNGAQHYVMTDRLQRLSAALKEAWL